MKIVIQAKIGMQIFPPGACPGHDPRFGGVAIEETFHESINPNSSLQAFLPQFSSSDHPRTTNDFSDF
jgi:hypothetical protein